MDIVKTTTIANLVSTGKVMTYFTLNEAYFAGAYGEPTIDFGGTVSFTNSEDDADTFVLPTNTGRIVSDAPVSISFNGNTDDEAAYKLTGWFATIVTRLTSAKTTLMALDNPNTPTISTVTV